MAMDASVEVEEQMEIEEKVDTKETPKLSWAEKEKLRQERNSRPINIVRRFGVVNNPEGTELEFYQLITLLNQLHLWHDHQRTELLVQLMGEPGLFNAKCSDMVFALSHLKWSIIPVDIRADYINFLHDIAMVNPYHMNMILKGILINCLRVYMTKDDEVPAENEMISEEREAMFQWGLDAVYSLVPTTSARLPYLVELTEKLKVHKSAFKNKIFAYFRLLMTLADRYPMAAKEFWYYIIEALLKFDSEISHGLSWQNMNDARQIFPKNETGYVDVMDDEIVDDSPEAQMRAKFDDCMLMVLCYASLGIENPSIKPSDHNFTKWMEGLKPTGDLLSKLSLSLESQVLYVHEVENVPFIWFYMCAKSPEMLNKLLTYLWQMIITPLKTPNDWKKTHNAVMFMASLLARGKFVELETAHFWLKQMIEWCINYVNNARQVKIGGGIQHGTFYATVQAAFFLLCFRYKEFNETKAAEDIRLWGIARIVHSQLEPLNFIPKPLALFFASISRYMQIVYCSHIVNMSNNYNGVETSFPFLQFGLKESSKLFKSCLRVFEPMENDLATLSSMRSRRTTEVTDGENDYDFMDDGIELDLDYDAAIIG